MLSLLKSNSAFFIPYSIFLLCGGVFLICLSKTDIAMHINGCHNVVADSFFKYYTNVGLGWLILPVVFMLAFVRLRYVIIAFVSFLITFIINDTLKQIAGTPRPVEVFAQLHQSLYLVSGVDLYYWNSFPSGHTAIAFSLFLVLALCYRSKILKFLFFIMAFLVAYSRMYLSEHFLADVYVASIIGVTVTLFSYSMGINLAWLNKFVAMDKPLINLRVLSGK
jgi:membrane-associated phospholipid phosphatase